MKKLNILALMLAIAASCTVSEIDSKFTVKAPDIIASFEDKSTKTVITTDSEGVGTIWWKPGDEINVFYGTTSTHYTSTNREKATAAAFTTTDIICLTESGQDVAQGNVWGLYPYDRNAECDGSSVITTVKAVQSAVPDTFDDDLYPSLAHSTNTMMTFYNVLGGLKFTLSRDDISRITFKGNNDEDLAGKVKLSMNSDNLPEAVVVEGEKTITFTPKDGRTFEKDTSYYLVMLPVVLSNGFTMTFETETEIGIFNYEGNSVEIERSVFGRKENIDTYATFESNGNDFLEPFTITSIGNASVAIAKANSYARNLPILEYRINSGIWNTYTIGEIVDLADGDVLQYRAGESGNEYFSNRDAEFKVVAEGSGKFNVSGNIMSLLSRTERDLSMKTGSFYGLFSNCDKLLDASNLTLPVMQLSDGDNCHVPPYYGDGEYDNGSEFGSSYGGYYGRMFFGCTSLTGAPELPATQLGVYCYKEMFSGCTSLVEAPKLPATQLARGCYSGMFSGCTSLTEAPELPAMQLASAEYIYEDLDLDYPWGDGCYENMFSGCTSLIKVPELPAMQLANACYLGMFSGCTSLTEAPELPATQLATGCYSRMFSGCTSLTEAPELPATHLEYHCYDRMFYGCSNLSYVKCLAEYRNDPDVVEEEYLTMAKYTGYEWLKGVSSTGTFVKSAANGWWVGIPEGWQVINHTPVVAEYVDLGLSVKWSTCDVGAISPAGHGYIFQWAAVEPFVPLLERFKGYFYYHLQDCCPYMYFECNYDDLDNFYYYFEYSKYWVRSSSQNFSGNPDNKTVLDSEDDVAHVKYGEGWRIPTEAEWMELKNNCTWVWTNNYNGTGCSGCIVTSNKSGYTDKSIFLPICGRSYLPDESYVENDKWQSVYIENEYWSSSLDKDNSEKAFGVRIGRDGLDVVSKSRECLRFVRPVFK